MLTAANVRMMMMLVSVLAAADEVDDESIITGTDSPNGSMMNESDGDIGTGIGSNQWQR